MLDSLSADEDPSLLEEVRLPSELMDELSLVEVELESPPDQLTRKNEITRFKRTPIFFMLTIIVKKLVK